ncbi:MAG TPA: hypothetical protein VE914_17610 [Candidatus Angelobacter sp.]|nr:hypothetical protein [Candidatus Angelobacter sp.]
MTTTKSRRAGGNAKRTITIDELGKVQFKAAHVDAERISSEETWLGARQSLWAAAALMSMSDKKLAKFIGGDTLRVLQRTARKQRALTRAVQWRFGLAEDRRNKVAGSRSASHFRREAVADGGGNRVMTKRKASAYRRHCVAPKLYLEAMNACFDAAKGVVGARNSGRRLSPARVRRFIETIRSAELIMLTGSVS